MSTVEKGNAFRDQVMRMMAAAGYDVEGPEVRVEHIKADAGVFLKLDGLGGTLRILVETKDYEKNLDKAVCNEFINNYGSLIDERKYDRAWLIARNGIAPDAKLMVDRKNGLKAFEFTALQRLLFNVDKFLEAAIADYKQQEIDKFYIQPRLSDGSQLSARIDNWLDADDAPPIAIIGGYGSGKSTFSYYIAWKLAEAARIDSTKRVPIRVPLADVFDDQSMEGLFGKIFASGTARVLGYHYSLFYELNSAGRFVLIFDGFDEMKHGMTFNVFERNVNRILSLDGPEAKIVILGRDTALHNDLEFRAIINGEQRTTHGQTVKSKDRRGFDHYRLADFTVDEAHSFIASFFPTQARKYSKAAIDQEWLDGRIKKMNDGSFDDLIIRPVHAQMLCQVATDAEFILDHLSKFALYDRFVHLLIEREVSKTTRSDNFDRECRRKFNASVAWWMWENGGIATTTLADIPLHLITDAVIGIAHGLNESELRRELTIGLLVQKGDGERVYFGHRSIQEFLVAEHLIENDMYQSAGLALKDIRSVLGLLNDEIVDFLVQGIAIRTDNTYVRWLEYMRRMTGTGIDVRSLELFRQLFSLSSDSGDYISPEWNPILAYVTFAGRCDFDAGPQETNFLREILARKDQRGTKQQAALFMLCARVLQKERDATLAEELIAEMLQERAIEHIEQMSRAPAGKQTFRVSRHREYEIYSFLRFVTVKRESSGEWSLKLDLIRLEEDAAEIAGYGFAAGDARTSSLIVSGNQVSEKAAKFQRKRHGVRGTAASRFIQAETLRRHVAPLIVTTMSTSVSESKDVRLPSSVPLRRVENRRR